MSIDLTGLSARELGALIRTAKKQQTIVAKRRPITKVRAQLTKLAKTEGYTIEELFGAPRPRAPARPPRPPRHRPRPPAASWARLRRSTATRPTRRKPGPAVASSRAGWPS
jgi:DNA-binding protein H-NS